MPEDTEPKTSSEKRRSFERWATVFLVVVALWAVGSWARQYLRAIEAREAADAEAQQAR